MFVTLFIFKINDLKSLLSPYQVLGSVLSTRAPGLIKTSRLPALRKLLFFGRRQAGSKWVGSAGAVLGVKWGAGGWLWVIVGEVLLRKEGWEGPFEGLWAAPWVGTLVLPDRVEDGGGRIGPSDGIRSQGEQGRCTLPDPGRTGHRT